MRSYALDLLSSFQNSSNRSSKSSIKNHSFNSFQNVLCNKQQNQSRPSFDNTQKINDYKRDNTRSYIKDKKYPVNYYNRTKAPSSQTSSDKTDYLSRLSETNSEVGHKAIQTKENSIKNIEEKVNDLEQSIESILTLVNLLRNQDNNESFLASNIEQLSTRIEELLPQLEILQEVKLGQVLPNELQDMFSQLLSSLDETMSNVEIIGFDTENVTNFKDILRIVKFINTSQNNSDVEMNHSIGDSNDVFMNSVENSQNKTDNENPKGYDDNNNDLLDAKSGSSNNISADDSNNQNKTLFNHNLVNSQTQKISSEIHNSLKGEANKLYDVDKDSLIKQIVDKVKVDMKGKNSQIKIKLKPDFLGEMSLKLSLEKGVISAKAFVQDYHVKQLIESNLSQLRENLEGQGVSIENFEVSVGDDSNFQRQSMNWNRQNNRRFSNLKVDENDDKYDNYLDWIVDNNSGLDVNELHYKKSSINLKA